MFIIITGCLNVKNVLNIKYNFRADVAGGGD